MVDPDAIAPQRLAAPTGLVSAAGNGVVTLAWDPVRGDVLFYEVFAGPAPDALTKRFEVQGATRADVTGLTNGATWFFAVTACDSVGSTSARSPVVFATPSATAASPTVLASTPAHLATDVPATAAIALSFSTAMDRGSVEAAFSSTPPVSCAWTWSSGDTLATCAHAAPLAASTSYTMNLSPTAKDIAGGSVLAPGFVFSFTTAATLDVTPPTVVSTSPADLSKGAPFATNVSITFSEPVDKASAQAALAVSTAAGSVLGNVTWSTDGKTMTFDPAADLSTNDVVTCSLSTAAQDLAGNPLAAPATFSFSVLRFAVAKLYSDATLDGVIWSAGSPSVFANGTSLYVGDNDSNYYGRAFVSFDLSQLPASVTAVDGGTLWLFEEAGGLGSPFATLGSLLAERVDYGASLDQGDLTLDALDATTYTVGALGVAPEQKYADVGPSVAAAWANRPALASRIQFRLRFATNTNGDGAGDTLKLGSGETLTPSLRPLLSVGYLYP
jgi:methionine-rich copper-binding protein CopC